MIITVKDDDAAFVWVNEWFLEQKFLARIRRLESLDEALLRPGRIDCKLYLGKASTRQKIELYRRFFPESSESEVEAFVETYAAAETMAEFQGQLLGLEQEQGSWELVGSASAVMLKP
jgi:ATP-dependent 26S proteasome regulatory subunit